MGSVLAIDLKIEEIEILGTMGKMSYLDSKTSAKPSCRTNKGSKACFQAIAMLVHRQTPNILDLPLLMIILFASW